MKTLISIAASVLLLSAPLSAFAVSNPKINVQWAQSTVPDWSLVDVGAWATQPTKADPIGDTTSLTGIGDILLNGQKGWIFAINVQGVVFSYYDHYAIQGTASQVIVTAWRDDPLLFPVGTRQADVATINSLKFDAKVGQDNTDQSYVWYREGAQYDNLIANGAPENVTVARYSDFVAPDASIVKPGIYLSDTKYNEFIAAETEKGWR